MTLRERVLALADDPPGYCDVTDTRALALAAARLALEDAESIALAGFNRADTGDDIADAIRALRDGIA